MLKKLRSWLRKKGTKKTRRLTGYMVLNSPDLAESCEGLFRLLKESATDIEKEEGDADTIRD